MSAGKLKEPRVITNFRQRVVCVLPVGFYFDDERWEKIFDRFERKGDDLHSTIQVDLYTALLGGKVRVPTLSGPVMLTIKPETQNGQTFRLRGKGMPKLRKKGQYGDLYAKLDVQLPTQLTPRQRELLAQMREAG